MNEGRSLFSQLLEHAPHHHFRRCVERYRGNRGVRSFRCWDQFLCMAFAQLTYRESLRDIEACLGAVPGQLYHLGIRGTVTRSTLADANEKRDWRIYADFAQVLISEARRLYAEEPLDLALKRTVYALDSSTIDLCISLFPWAQYQKHAAGVKLHTLLDLQGSIPAFIRITSGSYSDARILDELVFQAGAIYVFDRAYVDFRRLHRLDQAKATFVTRAKSNFKFKLRRSARVDRSTGVICDQTIVLKIAVTAAKYPNKLRRIRYKDAETGKGYVFLTNDFSLPALTITLIYKARWRIELFFKWIKQHLRIKAFYGRSPNAVKAQIWVAISVYVLVAIVKKRLGLKPDLYTLLQILSVHIFDRTELRQALSGSGRTSGQLPVSNQLQLFNF
jgi:hypothetical protein